MTRSSRQHTDREYEGELGLLRDRLLRMTGRVEHMIGDAIRAVDRRDAVLARCTIDADTRVNTDEVEIDELCLSILARRQPLGSDLRFLAGALKMVTDLERIGDLAVNIAERAQKLLDDPTPPPPTSLPRMAELAQGLVRDAIDAFVHRDAERARNVIARDDEIDEMYHQLLRQILQWMQTEPSCIERGLHLQAVAKFIERIGDHGTNLAEEVVFLVQGRDVRHKGKRVAAPTR